jgi:prevent-host-death family protein
MAHITSGELQKNFGMYRTMAMKEPVTVTNHGREDLVMLSIDEYRRLQRLEQRAFHASQMTDQELAALDTIVIPPEAARYNHEIA